MASNVLPSLSSALFVLVLFSDPLSASVVKQDVLAFSREIESGRLRRAHGVVQRPQSQRADGVGSRLGLKG